MRYLYLIDSSCSHAALFRVGRGRFDSRFTNSLLTAKEESSRDTHDLWRHGHEIVFPHEPKRDAVTGTNLIRE